MIMDNLGIIIIGIMLVTTTILLIIMTRVKNKPLPKKKRGMARQIDFDKDIEYLLYIINFKCINYQEFIVKSRAEIDGKLMGDKYLDDVATSITVNIMESLSLEYKNTLYKYFNTENSSLEEYVAEMVFIETSKGIIKQNKATMRNGNKSI